MRLAICAGLISAAALGASCAAKQKITITTTPAGAEVSMVKRGHREVSGGVGPMHGHAHGDTFEDPELYLGVSPLTYEFEIEVTEAGFHAMGASVSEKKVTREMLIRVRHGAASAERRVSVTGEPITLEIPLPAEEPPAAPPSS